MTAIVQRNRWKTALPARGVFHKAARPANDARDVAKWCFRGPRSAERRAYVR